jgi:hypothetical protein
MKLLREDKSEKVDFSYVGLMYGAFERVMRRFMYGEKKYAKMNFENCTDDTTYKESLIRHTAQYIAGLDDDDHLSAVAVNALILLHLESIKTRRKT